MAAFTRKDIIKLLAEHGVDVNELSVCRWSQEEYEAGAARLVGAIKVGGFAYSVETVQGIAKRLKNGWTFYISRKSDNSCDYDFGTTKKKPDVAAE